MTLRGAASQRDLDLLREWVTTQLSGMEKLEAEREKSHDTSRQDAQRALSEQNKAVEARLTQLNGFKSEITEERGAYARRDYVDGKIGALDAKLTDSRDDRAMMHVRLETLAALEQQVKVNTEEIATQRGHVHAFSTELEKVIARPAQFARPDEDEIRRMLALARKFGFDDGFTQDEMNILHRVADSFKGKAATRLRRLTTLESVFLGAVGTTIALTLVQIVIHHVL